MGTLARDDEGVVRVRWVCRAWSITVKADMTTASRGRIVSVKLPFETDMTHL